MKIHPSLLLATAVPALALSSAFAGEAAPAKAETVVIEEPTSIFDSSVTVDYASTYEFRGVDFGDHLVDVDASTAIDLGNDFSLSVGAWYASLVQDDYTELNLYTGLSKSFGDFSIGLGYTWYYFGSDGADANEVNVTGSYSIIEDTLALEGGAFYDFETEGYYFVTALSYTQELTDCLGLEVTGGISYNIDYYVDNSGFNNAFLQVGLPIALTDTATFTPYVRGSLSMNTIEAFQDDIVLGGASLSVSF